jgi:DNA-binding NtrC family response regulator
MREQRLLWITEEASGGAFEPWREHFTDFSINEVAQLTQLRQALTDWSPDCVLVTGTTPDASSMEILELVQSINISLPVIFCEEDMTVMTALQLIRAGAHHCSACHEGPAVIRDQVELAISERRHRTGVVKRTAGSAEPWRNNLVGESREMSVVADVIRQIGPRRCTVLISGETGTGKEVAARALHMAGPRGAQPFVAINCSALPENLLEAELFGHVKGAFTGAVNHRVGRFEQAHKGTLFLDEIGEMPLDMQAKLLRVLQEREVQRLGGTDTIKVDVRVIAATNVDLLERVQSGRFREDLYYRLNVVPIHMPPLRTRTNDIPLLVYHFVRRVCQSEGLSLRRVTPEAMERLKQHAWPGNVRQLENAVEKAIVLSEDRDVLTPADFGLASVPRLRVVSEDTPSLPEFLPEGVKFEAAVSRFEAEMLSNAMKKTGGNKTAAAELLGLKRTTLIMKLRSFESLGKESCAKQIEPCDKHVMHARMAG